MFNPEQGKANHEGGVDRNEKIRQSLRDFIQKNGMTAQQVEDAFFVCIDKETKNTDDESFDECVSGLAKRFSDAEQEGFALNEIGSIVSEMARRMDAPEQLLAFINSLPVDDRSRRSLRSIFEKNRTGEIRFIDQNTLKYIIPTSMRLPNAFKALSVEDRAEQLLDVLSLFVKKIGNREFGIEFSEEG
ncbi:MAG: hypothetical protein WCJ25_04245 [Candidatus Moraniibacteriota bacterium]